MRLGKGIATVFRDKFGACRDGKRSPPLPWTKLQRVATASENAADSLAGGLDELRSCGARVGEVHTLRRGDRCVFYLVTKPRSSGTYPTVASMRAALESLRTRVRADGVTALAMPRIGCGLDGMVWEGVRALIREVFAGSSGLTITVYAL